MRMVCFLLAGEILISAIPQCPKMQESRGVKTWTLGSLCLVLISSTVTYRLCDSKEVLLCLSFPRCQVGLAVVPTS